ncbi:MAG: RdgB/HAM1 family non-canonical purine NTP pyrophosphatase [Pseudomonadota bacterium]
MPIPKLTSQDTLIVASNNMGKVREIQDLLSGFAISITSAADHNLPEPEETGTTFAQNAHLKAQAAAQTTGLPALSDDSGLEVEALEGAPGLYSARWAGPNKNFHQAMGTIYTKLQDQDITIESKPRANFVCALCLCWPDGQHEIFEGKVFGHLVWPARGTKGFGYDPMFVPDGYDITFGEMDPAHKHKISHRAKAFELFVQSSFGEF